MDKFHLVITGRRNTGKSSIANTILQQDKAVVSPIAGTTTDPVKKSYEIPGVASVVLIDTAGTDDEGELGELRVKKTFETIRQADAALLVITGNRFGHFEEIRTEEFQKLKLPFLIVHNKSDLEPLQEQLREKLLQKYGTPVIGFSTCQAKREMLIQKIGTLVNRQNSSSLLGDLVCPGQMVMLVTPIDSEAPTGRMILPQVQMLREILDRHGIGIVVQPEEITTYFQRNSLRPDLVITDSQVFGKIAPWIPQDIPFTSFSIILAHHKGNFDRYLTGTSRIPELKDGDRILLLESCSHHVSCEDIGRVKIPALLRKYTGKQLEFDHIAGLDRIERPITDYALIIQCGGCMITATQLRHRLQPAIDARIPVSNYGMTIAWLQGIFDRATQVFTCYRPNPSV